jgi:hypothetical protein
MFISICLFIGMICGGTLFVRTDGHNITYKKINYTYNRLKRLKRLVSTKHSSNFMIFFVSSKMLAQSLYISIIQYLNNSVKKIDKNMYQVSYVINGKMYNMIVKPTKGPTPILQIIDNTQRDITDEILPYMGPNYDWHNTKFNPEFFGYDSLYFQLSNGEEFTFASQAHFNFD